MPAGFDWAKWLEPVPPRPYHRDWLDASKGKGRASKHFGYSGPLTEFKLMGNVALGAGKKLDFDWKNMKVTNVTDANRYVKPHYRQGRTI